MIAVMQSYKSSSRDCMEI